MVKLGNFLFRYRNVLFPLFYVLLFIPSMPLIRAQWFMIAAGFIVALAGQTIRVMTIGLKYIIRGGSKRRVFARDLVTDGMFSHCRNPLYVGNIILLVGLGIMANSVLFAIAVLPLFLITYMAIVRAEEAYLLDKFGDAYREYMHEVNRWVPDLRGIVETFRSMSFHWKRVIIREYNTSYIWMTGAVLIVMVKLARMPDDSLFHQLLPCFILTLIVLLTLYFTVRYLKKSKRLRDT